MSTTDKTEQSFDKCIGSAADCLRDNKLNEAYGMIIEAILLNPDSPQPHNLLGIWFELTGNGDKARRHYRAAYSLDPTFRPACANLERICTLFDMNKPRLYDFGNGPEYLRG